MFKGMSKFQIVLMSLFAFFIVAGLGAFALFKGHGKPPPPQIVIWGTIEKSTVDNYLGRVMIDSKNAFELRYVLKPTATFESALLEALATGHGPDAILVGQSDL